MLLMKLDKLKASTSGVGTTVDTMKTSMVKRFVDIEKDRNDVLATTLDPRYPVARVKAVLNAEKFSKSHTGDNIAQEISN